MTVRTKTIADEADRYRPWLKIEGEVNFEGGFARHNLDLPADRGALPKKPDPDKTLAGVTGPL